MNFISVIIPCRNEMKFLPSLLDNLAKQSWPQEKMEIILADGMSDDGTWEYLSTYAQNHSNIKLIRNEMKVVPFALNEAIRVAKGNVIVRMDAHSGYPLDYIMRLVQSLQELEADNVGGMWVTKPGNDSLQAKAIALATSHPLGIGNALYRLGANAPMLVDTVPYGCFNKEIFERLGYFDTDLIRNQDDEFNARINKSNGKIYLIPDVKIDYFARENLSKMSRMFYQYGLFKPLVNLKVGSPATLRQFAPPILVLATLVSILLLISGILSPAIFLIFMALYLLPVICISLMMSIRHSFYLFIWLVITFPCIHYSYGWGYIRGILKFSILGKHKRNTIVVRDNR